MCNLIFMYKQTTKKGFVELTSFTLLTGLILILSISSYLIISDILNSKIEESQKSYIATTFKKLDLEISQISSFTGSSFSYPLNLEKGVLHLKNDSIMYISETLIGSNNSVCFENICYGEISGYESTKLLLENSFIFKNNLTLTSQNQILIFTNLGGNKLDVKIK